MNTNNTGNSATPNNKAKALSEAIKQIEKAFGKGAIMTGNSRGETAIEVISSGSISLDIALGAGGYPRGRIIEIYGNESSGKTSLALQAIAEAQKLGKKRGVDVYCAIIDVEHALDLSYAKKLGVNIDTLIVSQPDNAEQALEICETLVRSGSVDIVVLDSVAALVPKAEIEGEMGDSHMGLHARMMSQALRKLTAAVSHTGAVMIFINQIRMKIGVMFGNPETTTGGNALKFYASVRMEVRRGSVIKNGDNIIGSESKVKIVKNKVAPPFRTAEFDILYGEGVSKYGELVDLGVRFGVIDKSGAWFAYKSEKIGQGRENAKKYLKNNPTISDEIEANIRRIASDGNLDLILDVGREDESSQTEDSGIDSASNDLASGSLRGLEGYEKNAANDAEDATTTE